MLTRRRQHWVAAPVTLQEIAAQANADPIVTGAYGPSGGREWLLGGVTSDLLADPSLNRFMSN